MGTNCVLRSAMANYLLHKGGTYQDVDPFTPRQLLSSLLVILVPSGRAHVDGVDVDNMVSTRRVGSPAVHPYVFAAVESLACVEARRPPVLGDDGRQERVAGRMRV